MPMQAAESEGEAVVVEDAMLEIAMVDLVMVGLAISRRLHTKLQAQKRC